MPTSISFNQLSVMRTVQRLGVAASNPRTIRSLLARGLLVRGKGGLLSVTPEGEAAIVASFPRIRRQSDRLGS